MKNLKLLLIAIVLVAVAFALQHGSRPEVAPDPFVGKNLVEAADIDGISGITLKSDQGSLELKKVNGIWRLPGLYDMRVDSNRLEEFFQQVNAAKIVESVSGNPQRHADLGVASVAVDAATVSGADSALITLKDVSGATVRELYLGKGRQAKSVDGSQGFGNDGQYFRFGGSDYVYLLSSFIWLDKDQKNWLGKELVKISADKLKQIAWKYSDDSEKFSLARAGATDSLVLSGLAEDMQTKQSALPAVQNFFANLTFDDFIATDSPELHKDLSDSLTLAVESFDGLKLQLLVSSGAVEIPGKGKMHLLWLGAEYAGSDAGVRSIADELAANAKKMLYALQEHRVRPLMLKSADLSEAKPKPEPAADASGTAEVASAAAAVSDKVSASHILLAYKGAERSEATRSDEEAKKLAEELLDRIKKGEDFGKIASENSDCPSGKSAAGSLGEFGRGMMAKEFEDAAYALEVGKISGVVKSPFGYHIIRRDK
ncbi:hypothetical protein MASR1M12_12420 [Erysipelotrichia bacterium]